MVRPEMVDVAPESTWNACSASFPLIVSRLAPGPLISTLVETSSVPLVRAIVP